MVPHTRGNLERRGVHEVQEQWLERFGYAQPSSEHIDTLWQSQNLKTGMPSTIVTTGGGGGDDCNRETRLKRHLSKSTYAGSGDDDENNNNNKDAEDADADATSSGSEDDKDDSSGGGGDSLSKEVKTSEEKRTHMLEEIQLRRKINECRQEWFQRYERPGYQKMVVDINKWLVAFCNASDIDQETSHYRPITLGGLNEWRRKNPRVSLTRTSRFFYVIRDYLANRVTSTLPLSNPSLSPPSSSSSSSCSTSCIPPNDEEQPVTSTTPSLSSRSSFSSHVLNIASSTISRDILTPLSVSSSSSSLSSLPHPPSVTSSFVSPFSSPSSLLSSLSVSPLGIPKKNNRYSPEPGTRSPGARSPEAHSPDKPSRPNLAVEPIGFQRVGNWKSSIDRPLRTPTFSSSSSSSPASSSSSSLNEIHGGLSHPPSPPIVSSPPQDDPLTALLVSLQLTKYLGMFRRKRVQIDNLEIIYRANLLSELVPISDLVEHCRLVAYCRSCYH